MVSWPAVASIVAGLANLYLFRYLWRSRDAPGARWFSAVIGVQVFWGVVYGAALLVFDPTLRLALEVATWLAPIWIGVPYLAFALAYTGRRHLLSTVWFRLVVGFALVSTALVVTNPLHGLAWSGFALDPVFGAATVSYAHQPWVYVQYFATFAMTSTAVLVLLDTVASYGPLYRAQSVAVALTPVPPAAAFTLWTFQLGPFWQLNLTAIMFLPHVGLDLYALFRRDMFELSPATRRVAERAAIDDLGNPVVVVDEAGRVVTLNDAAERVLGTGKRSAFTEALSDLLAGESVDLTAEEQRVVVRVDGRPRTFDVTPSPLTDGAGGLVGYTVVFYDLTEELRREQRLDVLNRVLRHNLRNDMGVVRAYAAAAAGEVTDVDGVDSEEVTRLLATVEEKADALLDLGEKARAVERVLSTEPRPETVDVGDLLSGVVDEVTEAYPTATLTLDCPDEVTVSADPASLRGACRNLVENAAEHGGEEPTVAVRVETDGASVEVSVEDDGPGIPEHELATLDAGEETPLQHGSGLGLWSANWLADRAGATLSFETGDGGTLATLTVPR